MKSLLMCEKIRLNSIIVISYREVIRYEMMMTTAPVHIALNNINNKAAACAVCTAQYRIILIKIRKLRFYSINKLIRISSLIKTYFYCK